MIARVSLYLLKFAFVTVWIGGLAAEEQKWPFCQPVAAELPEVTAKGRLRNPIDAFILQKLEAQKLTLAPEASKRALVRRLYFDLIGVPPSPEEVETFLKNESLDAYEKLVDKLLADPRYGERWARFWLDLARYADTAGFEGDPDLPWAWRYRNYVIDSLNRDKRYDQFIKEQIAGDEFDEIMGAGELPLPKSEYMVAMTFLRLAPFTEPRGDETRHEMLSEMTSTVSSVFLGLTVGCAKCHDHKYDNIPTRDFYRMKAFFATIQLMPPERGDGLQIGGPLPAAWYRKGEKEWVATRRGELEKEAAGVEQEYKSLKAELENRLKIGGAGFTLQSEGGTFGNNYVYDRASVSDGELHFTIANSDGKRWQYFTDGTKPAEMDAYVGRNQGHWLGDIRNLSGISLGRYTQGTGAITHPGGAFRGKLAGVLVYDHPLDEKERKQISDHVSSRVSGDPDGVEIPGEGLRFWLDASDLDADSKTPNPLPGASVSKWIDKVGGLELRQTDAKLQPRLGAIGSGFPAVQFDEDLMVGDASKAAFAGDRQGSLVAIYTAPNNAEEYLLVIGNKEKMHLSMAVSHKRKGATSLADALKNRSNPLVTDEERLRYRVLSTRGEFIRQHLKRLQPLAMSLRHAHGPPYEPGVPTSRVMIRGEYDNPGEVVVPGFLSAIEKHQEPARIRLDPFKRWPTRSRRMALAKWIASKNNPLTARVMMNRLWYRHFGRGIVETPSDFGELSGGPSHRELLDWLALQFMEKEWSLKAMHRVMVNSSTYRQSSLKDDERAAEIDADNRLLWRFNRRRLGAEAVRDSVLAVSGRLNGEMFGLPIFPPLPDGMDERVKYGKSKWATDLGAVARRRSVYIYQQRTLTMPFMQSFDGLVCEDSIPRRRTSVTPLQALAMYNGDFVNEEARHFAGRVASEAGGDPEERVNRAFLLAFGRSATAGERSELREFAVSEEKLVGLCRILYNASEFVYVD